jgi:hypothetical protein
MQMHITGIDDRYILIIKDSVGKHQFLSAAKKPQKEVDVHSLQKRSIYSVVISSGEIVSA